MNFQYKYTKEDIEKYLSSVFWEVFNYKDKIDTQSSFNKVLLAIIERSKFIDIYRQNKSNNQIYIKDVSVDLHNISQEVVARLILFKENNSQLIDYIKSLDESDSEIITRKYYLNQSIKDISNNTGLKVSTYA